jgi:hypothetical protein
MPNRFREMPPKTFIMEWLHYDPTSGLFTWMKEPSIIAGRDKWHIAGTTRESGYVLISLGEYGQVFAHRLAWVYVHGEIPPGMEVDHKDRNPNNNAIDNLRLATSSQQKQNRGVQSNNRSGLKGAYYHAIHKGKKWRSQIKVGKRLIFLGYFDTAEEAHAAYCAAAKEHHGEFARVA